MKKSDALRLIKDYLVTGSCRCYGSRYTEDQANMLLEDLLEAGMQPPPVKDLILLTTKNQWEKENE